jgi:hypothetical protein
MLYPVLRTVLLPGSMWATVRSVWLSLSGAAEVFRRKFMFARKQWAAFAAVLIGLLATVGHAQAARIRYHYIPADPAGPAALLPPGERLTWAARWEPYNCPPPRPTCRVPFRHPCTGQQLTLPLALPASTPRMEHRPNRIIYNYGSDTVEVHFLPDGSADVIYNSGLLRAP